MANITLAMDEKLLSDGRKYAQQNGMSFNELIRTLVRQTVQPQEDWLDGLFALADEAGGNSGGKSWEREDLYRAI